MPYVEGRNIENFKEWINIDEIKKGRFQVVVTDDNEVFVLSLVTTQGLIKPFITGLTDKEVEEIKNWFNQQGIKIRDCKHIYIDDRKDPREIRKEKE